MSFTVASTHGSAKLAVIALLLGFLSLRAAAASGAPLEVTSDHPRQGQTIEVSVQSAGEAASLPSLQFHGQNFKLFASGNGKFLALLAIPADLEPGTYPLSLGSDKIDLHVTSGNFAVQRIHLPAGKDNFDTSPGEAQAVDKAKGTLSEQRNWQGKFVRPSRARVSAGYGMRRMVNGRLLKDYFHSGLDFAANLGSPVVSTAPGKVVLAGHGFKLHGNVVAIDHGQGVVSFYIHLQKILVKEGQQVKAGQLIGLVGQTGRANGPHLHFSLYVNQVAANPGDWFENIY